MQRHAEQRDLGLRVGAGQRLHGRQREHEVAEPAAAEHGDPPHVLEAASRVAGPLPWLRLRLRAHETTDEATPPGPAAFAPVVTSARAGTRTETPAAAPAPT